MDWNDVAAALDSNSPMVAAALRGSSAPAIGALVASSIGAGSTPDLVVEALRSSPDAMQRVAELQANARVQLQQLAVAAETARVGDAVASGTDAVTARRFDSSWRAVNGYVVAIASALVVLFCCGLFAAALATRQLQALAAIPELASSVALILGIPGAAVGITAWHVGRADALQARVQVTP